MFFKGDGTLLGPAGNFSSTGGVVFQQPLITAADGQADTGNGGFVNPFYGTSCAAPTGASVAALIKSADTALTPAQIKSAMLNTAIDIDVAGPDADSGYGIVMPYPAMQSLALPGKAFAEFNTYTLSEACGDGDGLVSPGETGTLTVNLKNTGTLSATDVTSTLTSSTAGVTVTQPSSTFPNLTTFSAGSNNNSPYKFTLDPSVPVDAVVNFTLTLNYADGWTPSQVINFTVQTGRQPIISTIDNAAPAPSSSFPVTGTGLQAQRLSRADPPSSCAAPKAFPGKAGAGTRRFDAYTLTNPTGSAVCVSATITTGKELTDLLQVAAYLGSFNPADISQNYLADIGTSPGNPSSVADPKTLSFTVPGNATVVITVNETASFVGQTSPGSGTGTPYTLQVLGLPLTAVPGTPCSAATPAPTATPSLTTHASQSVTLGSSTFDTATIAGGNNPSGTITFRAFGPDDATCGGTVAFTSTVSVNGNGSYDSATFTPTTAGTYRWVATYSGDSANNGATTACNDANESVVVSPATTPTPTPTATPTPTPAVASQTVNLSTRMLVQTGDNIGIGGFIITGTGTKHVIVRAIGPSLSQFGITNALADPVLQLQGSSIATVTNDNWRDTQEAQIQADGIPPTNDLESAIDANLAPGSYTALVSGNNGGTGVALIEVYDLDTGATSTLANLSTRAFVNTGGDIVIAGFVLGNNNGNDRVVVRGLGPSLANSGVGNVLADPTIQLRDSNGTTLFTDNDWQDNSAQAAELTADGLAPSDPKEAAIAATLPPGAYTALLSGVNNTTGAGLVEIYSLGP
jgi:hypothetical protein